jgi:carbamoyl-phosphate synthase large subunit
MGGQTALNAAMDLYEKGILEKYNVELIGAKVDSIRKAESRELFHNAMIKIGLDVAKGKFVQNFLMLKSLRKRSAFRLSYVLHLL